MTVALQEAYGVWGEIQFGAPYQLPKEGLVAEPSQLPNVAIGNAAVEASKQGPEATMAFGLLFENFGFAVDTSFSEVSGGTPYRLYEAPPSRWGKPEVQGVLGSFMRIAGATGRDSCVRNDVAAGEATGTRVHIGNYPNGKLNAHYLLVEGEERTGVGHNTRRYLDLVPLPEGDSEKRAEVVLRVANAFSFEERDAVQQMLNDNRAAPDEVVRVLQGNDRRTVQSVLDVELALEVVRKQDRQAAESRQGVLRRVGVAIGFVSSATDIQRAKDRTTGAVV